VARSRAEKTAATNRPVVWAIVTSHFTSDVNSIEIWLGMQIAYDLARVRARQREIKVRRYAAA
jgi:hypothetical protein